MDKKNKKIILEKIFSVSNPNSMHGLYPYRGKISAIDAKNIIGQLPNNGTLLDPFCGSGTIVYEALSHGLNVYGVDNNPLAIRLASAKISSQKSYNCICQKIIDNAKKDLTNNKYEKMENEPIRSFHKDTAAEIMCVKNYYDKMDDYLKGVFFGAIALTARGCNGYKWTSSTVGKNIEPKTYINFFEKFMSKAIKHSKYFLNNNSTSAHIIKGDSRKLSKYIKPKSIDYVFTSPPYFDGLDYTAYYGKLIYEIFGMNRVDIKQQLIQSVSNYKNDMTTVLEEIDKVTKEDSLIIFVVGDKKIKNKIINGGEFFNDIKQSSYTVEREYCGSSSQIFDVLNKTARKEQIVVWEKHKGEIVKYE